MSEVDKKIDNLMLMMRRGMKRIVMNTWIIPSKGDVHDESPDGFYPSVVVTEQLLGEVVVVLPEEDFKELLDAWRYQTLEGKCWYRKACRLFSDELQDKALSYLKFLEVRIW